jgi:hypothetical protein
MPLRQRSGGWPPRVGAPLSIRNLREDLRVAHDTAERWIEILERPVRALCDELDLP